MSRVTTVMLWPGGDFRSRLVDEVNAHLVAGRGGVLVGGVFGPLSDAFPGKRPHQVYGCGFNHLHLPDLARAILAVEWPSWSGVRDLTGVVDYTHVQVFVLDEHDDPPAFSVYGLPELRALVEEDA